MVVYFCLRCKFRLLLPHGQIIRFFLHKRWVLGYEMRKKEEKRCENGEFREGKDDFDLKKRYKRMKTEYFFVTLPCRMRRLVSVSAMLVSMRQKNIAQVSILERYFFVSTYQAAGPDTCLAVFVVASLPPCL